MDATRAAALVAHATRAAALVAHPIRAATWKSCCPAPRVQLFPVTARPYDIVNVVDVIKHDKELAKATYDLCRKAKIS